MRVKKARQPFHPAIQRSGMRFSGKNNPNGTIVFGAQYRKRSLKKEDVKSNKSVNQMLEKFSSKEELVEANDRVENERL